MSDGPKFADKAAELAAQAAAAAGPLKEKASELAAQAAAAAGPMAAQARERATGLAAQAAAAAGPLAAQAAAAAGPLAAQARERAAQGVEVLADSLDKLTGGKYSDRIGSLSTRLEDALSTASEGTGHKAAEPKFTEPTAATEHPAEPVVETTQFDTPDSTPPTAPPQP